MKFLDYLCYGPAGLSNIQMSFECGMILSYLTNRMFVIRNEEPQDHHKPTSLPEARIPDLFDIPIPYIRDKDTKFYYSKKHTVCSLTNFPFRDSVFFHSDKLDRKDFVDFVNRRSHIIYYTEKHKECDILTVGENNFDNLSHYSYFFYVRGKYESRMKRLLKEFRPKKPYRDFIKTVVDELNSFNSIHVRQGDFVYMKPAPFGIKNKTGYDLLKSVSNHFDTNKKIVVCTDDKNNLFDELKQKYECIFIDEFIREHKQFKYLPFRDDTTVAFLSQHIAGHSDDFIGTFGSTFTGLINRYRGKDDFKYLWAETKFDSPLQEKYFDNGKMKVTGKGSYSWNSFPYVKAWQGSWFREWPESFIL